MKKIFLFATGSVVGFILLSTTFKNSGSATAATAYREAGNNYNINVSTLAGKAGVTGYIDAKGDMARFNSPGQMVFDDRNQILYVADQGFDGLVIRAVDIAGNVSTYVEQNSLFNSVGDIALAPGAAGNLCMTSTRQDAVYTITRNMITGKGDVKKISGFSASGNSNGNDLASASFDGPKGCVFDRTGNLYVANDYFNTIRKLCLEKNIATSFAGKPAAESLGRGGYLDGDGDAALFNGIHDMALSSDGKFLVVPDYTNNALRKVMLSDRSVTSFFGDPIRGIDTDGPFSKAQAGNPEVAVCDQHNNVYFSSFLPGLSGGAKIRVAHLTDQTVFTIAGGQGKGSSRYRDGTGSEARFNGIKGIAITADGKTLFVSDRYNHCIRKISLY